MMSGGVTRTQLEALFSRSDDPWNHRTSSYEAEKFQATAGALLRPVYASALELGCGNGTLSRVLADRCLAYTGLDAVPVALDAARRAVPWGTFVQGFLPCRLPGGPSGAGHDLVVLSEILYFLDADGLSSLAAQIEARWPGADIVCVTWLGPSGNALEGEAALDLFLDAVPRMRESVRAVGRTDFYRIDVVPGLAE